MLVAQHGISENAERFLARTRHSLLIGGELVAAVAGKLIEVRNPSTGEVLGQLAAGDAQDMDKAVKVARAAFEGEWSRWTPYERQALLMRAYDLLSRRFDEVAEIESLDMGAPISRTRASKAAALRMVQFFSSMALSVRGETLPNGLPGDVTTMTLKAPVGVVGGIIPWNGSLSAVWWIIGAVLATGCTTVIKPATEASLSVLYLVEMLQEIGVPNGVVNVVTGHGTTAGDALARHRDVDRIAFTGSTETGRRIIDASKVNIKRLQLELGGKSPDIVFADADLEKAVPGAATGIFANSGQICYAGSRILVDRRIAKEFTARIADFVKGLRMGHSLDPEAQLGPLISEKQRDIVRAYVLSGKADGAKLVAGGERLEGEFRKGYFVPPTVFANVDMEMTIAREEIFGPVVSIIPFDTVDDAVRIGNQTEYGLAGAVWSQNISTALNVVDRIHAGVMWVNCYGLIDPLVGFNGAKMSGYGAKGGIAHLDTYLYTKSVYIKR
ncbi:MULTISPECIES: aldehyde dehydrogenase family protein [unclassified Mesorhizobium]|uniref:aldehyde dehydrogenase family protein n=1 Tax=unclassified Mesorhizobium TaxID=325217 RepID=UPI000FDA1475|nr:MULTISPECIES: aldehyde dehydrogenase family protein [unclassified Mesorhizobium]TGR18800.1 aldehyde dehydrogenase family protein [Mesorhizobium sp. M8A.F.Ca.ET.197.01.1.1]TGR37064.1 aldehyde dehydrogenase family protein [bacterium M00.F.Ca.ET.199.01.1.1]TGR41598.1 aldehyde dehydrogenase family protein [Mesorhizobium sp. M8A.F.Ca.ET.198.01.1.1]TGV85309.1 aldehyde dehydrogenase family protein [Mesorhizobium sp. M00.F.Ca.ET.149.01.1.1]